MANIKVSDLYPAGSELFSDYESYMNEVCEGELLSVQGGSTPICLRTIVSLVSLVSRVVTKVYP